MKRVFPKFGEGVNLSNDLKDLKMTLRKLNSVYRKEKVGYKSLYAWNIKQWSLLYSNLNLMYILSIALSDCLRFQQFISWPLKK